MPHSDEFPDIEWWKNAFDNLNWKVLWQVTPTCFNQFSRKEIATRDIGLHLHFCNHPEYGMSFNEDFALVEKNGWFVAGGKEQIIMLKKGIREFTSYFRRKPKYFTSGWFRCSQEVVDVCKKMKIVLVDRVKDNVPFVARYGMYSKDVYSKIDSGDDLVTGYTHTYEYRNSTTQKAFYERLARMIKYAQSKGYVNYLEYC